MHACVGNARIETHFFWIETPAPRLGGVWGGGMDKTKNAPCVGGGPDLERVCVPGLFFGPDLERGPTNLSPFRGEEVQNPFRTSTPWRS